ncbi:MAG TPA: ankyrin repeat domain-containing protein [Planctomycetota bacterium]|nr:ankyrin repeat domain-containing protein [Planctomycetota bacterium]
MTSSPVFFAILTMALVFSASASEIHRAAKEGDLEKIKALVKSNPGWLKVTFDGRRQPLHDAAAWGQPKAVVLLLELGADIQAVTEGGHTALHLAAMSTMREAPAVARALLEKGLPASVPTSDGHKITPLHLARDPAVARLLLEHKADVNARNASGTTALYQSFTHPRSLELIQVLLEKGALIEGIGERNKSALHAAVINGHLEATELLITQHKADINARSQDGQTPLDIVDAQLKTAIGDRRKRLLETQALLKKKGALNGSGGKQ